jgi:hypothetical protein
MALEVTYECSGSSREESDDLVTYGHVYAKHARSAEDGCDCPASGHHDSGQGHLRSVRAPATLGLMKREVISGYPLLHFEVGGLIMTITESHFRPV